MFGEKMWGNEPFWGLGSEWDPQWLLTDRQKKLQAELIELCRSHMRENAVESDKKLLYPRKNFQAPRQGGLPRPDRAQGTGRHGREPCLRRHGGRDHRPLWLPVDRHVLHHASGRGRRGALPPSRHSKPIQDIMRRIDKDCLVGTLSYSDPETGRHFWYPISSGAEETEDGWKVRKKASWTTSGGFADWYIVQTTRPDFDGNYSDLSCFLIMGNEVKADPANWDGLGLRGNQSGPIEVKDTISEGPPGRPGGRRRLVQRRMRRSVLPAVLVGLLERHLAWR